MGRASQDLGPALSGPDLDLKNGPNLDFKSGPLTIWVGIGLSGRKPKSWPEQVVLIVL